MGRSSSTKSLVIFGSGGHGWQSLKKTIDTWKGTVYILMAPIDWGGSTGTIGRTMEIFEEQLNEKLHKTKLPIFPFGDFNKVIEGYLLEKYGRFAFFGKDTPRSLLDYRSDCLAEHLAIYRRLKACLNLDDGMSDEFYRYVQIYLEYYEIHRQYVDLQQETSFGNIWHSFLYFYIDGLENICSFYKSKSLIPDSLHIIFSHTERQVLYGEYVQSDECVPLLGEDIIDSFRFPIPPETFRLLPKSTRLSSAYSTQISQQAFEIVKKASWIIIPNGSVANWAPLVNIPKFADLISKLSKKKKVFWMMNMFYSKNEYLFERYLTFFQNKDIKPVVLAPIQAPIVEYYKEYYNSYSIEGKTMYVPDYVNYKDIKFSLQTITEKDDAKVEGIKYDISSVRDAISQHMISSDQKARSIRTSSLFFR